MKHDKDRIFFKALNLRETKIQKITPTLLFKSTPLISNIFTHLSPNSQLSIFNFQFYSGRSGSASSSAVGLSAISLLAPLSLLSQRMPLQSLTQRANSRTSELYNFRITIEFYTKNLNSQLIIKKSHDRATLPEILHKKNTCRHSRSAESEFLIPN